jgi:hypothetical protein
MSLVRGEVRPGLRRFRPVAGDVSGAVADLGILVPLVAALVLVNGLDAGSVLLFAGLLVRGTWRTSSRGCSPTPSFGRSSSASGSCW